MFVEKANPQAYATLGDFFSKSKARSSAPDQRWMALNFFWHDQPDFAKKIRLGTLDRQDGVQRSKKRSCYPVKVNAVSFKRRLWQRATSLIEKETLKKRTVEPQNVEYRMSKEWILSIL